MYPKMKTTLTGLSTAIALALAGQSAQAVPINAADVVVAVDESGSMGGEHAWLPGMISDLDSNLSGAGIDGRYGLVGYGASSSHGIAGHQHDVGGGQFGTASEFDTATDDLVTSGGTEDGYDAIDTALGYTFRPDAATNIILVTDEDRDNLSSNSLDYSSILSGLNDENALLNAVVNCGFADGSGSEAIGVDSDGNAYIADGSGGFTTASGGQQSGACSGSTEADYVDLAWDTTGAAWDLNILRSGGDDATSFTNAFVDVKVQEIQEQDPNEPTTTTVPTPGSLALLGFGLLGLGWARRRS